MVRVFVDTSAWYAYINKNEPGHGRVVAWLDGFEGRLLTSDYVFDETVTLCRRRLGHGPAVHIGSVLLDPAVVEMLTVGAEEMSEAWQLFCARKDKMYSFTDCTSFVLMKRLGIESALTLDEDFQREGFACVP